jgi:hypothetical protein
MAAWTRDEHLAFAIAFEFKKATIPGFRKTLTEERSLQADDGNSRGP